MSQPVTIWIDAQLSPSLAAWIEAELGVSARSVSRLGLRDAEDADIFNAARDADAVILTKDADFEQLMARHGPPPRIIWLTFGNTSNAHIRTVLHNVLEAALELLAAGESLVEIRDPAIPRRRG